MTWPGPKLALNSMREAADRVPDAEQGSPTTRPTCPRSSPTGPRAMSASSSRPSGCPPVMSRRDLRGDAHRVFELVPKDPVLLGHDLERLACAEQGQRVVQPGAPAREDRLDREWKIVRNAAWRPRARRSAAPGRGTARRSTPRPRTPGAGSRRRSRRARTPAASDKSSPPRWTRAGRCARPRVRVPLPPCPRPCWRWRSRRAPRRRR